MKNFFDFYNLDMKYKKTSDNFTVREEPLYECDGEGDYIIVCINKKNLSTWDMTKIFSEYIGVKIREIGYCGMKDKDGDTSQYISFDKKYEEKLKSFHHKQITIISTSYHSNKLRIGHLKGNHFSVSLDDNKHFDILSQRIDVIIKFGMPNYFGFQRFGKDKENFLIGKDILSGSRKIREKHKSKLFVSAYQSHLFNNWLDDRLLLSKENKVEGKHPFKLLDGDMYLHYPYGKIFQSDDIANEEVRFMDKQISPTGLIAGEKVSKSSDTAYELEQKIDIINVSTSKLPKKQMLGARRFAWVFPANLKIVKNGNTMKIDFYLPKGSYATVLLEQIGVM